MQSPDTIAPASPDFWPAMQARCERNAAYYEAVADRNANDCEIVTMCHGFVTHWQEQALHCFKMAAIKR